MSTILVKPERTVHQAAVYWDILALHRHLYTTTEKLLALRWVRKRRCRRCDCSFLLGDEVGAAVTTQGTYLLCTGCVDALAKEMPAEPSANTLGCT